MKQFPLRKFYVQLEWQKKLHHALTTETVTFHSIHELLEQMTISEIPDTAHSKHLKIEKGNNLSKIFKFMKRKKSHSVDQRQHIENIKKVINTSNIIIEGKPSHNLL